MYSINSITFLGATALCALTAVAIVFAWQRYLASRRLKRFQNLDLVPNVLLTRHPILFISRARSLYRLAGDFLELPIFLREHGYLVEEVELRIEKLKHEETTKLLKRLLENPPYSATKVHLVLGQSFSEAALNLAFEGHRNLQSLTILGEGQKKTVRLVPTRVPVYSRPDLRPFSMAKDFEIELSALSHFVSLAESDLR